VSRIAAQLKTCNPNLHNRGHYFERKGIEQLYVTGALSRHKGLMYVMNFRTIHAMADV
jgi:hypothetical protein